MAILTVPSRSVDLERITGILQRQIGDRDDIEVLIADQEWSIGRKRQWALDNARGKYISHIDDDDLIAHDFVERIYPLLDGIDYVGFRMEHYVDGRKQKPYINSLHYNGWIEGPEAVFRGVSHLNPIRTEIARQGTFPDSNWGEDRDWAEQVHPETEHYIDWPGYMYFYSSAHSLIAGG